MAFPLEMINKKGLTFQEGEKWKSNLKIVIGGSQIFLCLLASVIINPFNTIFRIHLE